MSHTYHPRGEVLGVESLVNGDEPILYDDCPDCEEKSEKPLVSLDEMFTQALWRRMVLVEHGPDGPRYRSTAEAKACRHLYDIAVFLERHTRINPWTLFNASQTH